MKKIFVTAIMGCFLMTGLFSGNLMVHAAEEDSQPPITEPRGEAHAKVLDAKEKARLLEIVTIAITEHYNLDATDEEVEAYAKLHGIDDLNVAWEKLCDEKKAWIEANPWAKVVDKYNEKNGLNNEATAATNSTASTTGTTAAKVLPNTAAL